MAIFAVVRRIAGKKLEARARDHHIVTDRPPDEGGSDAGCTSGELFLMAVGSCSTGSLRNFLEAQHAPVEGLQTALTFEPSSQPGARDKIVITVTLPAGLGAFSDEEIGAAATSGRVVSRVKLGSEIEVRIERPAA